MEKIKFIQLNKDAKPIVPDGFGFTFKFIDGILSRHSDGTSLVLLYTGYKIILPEGYVGQVYDLPILAHTSIQRMVTTQIITNDFPYEESGNEALGFFLIYRVMAGLHSTLFSPDHPYIGINFFKNHGIRNMELEVDIRAPKPKVPENQQRQVKEHAQPRREEPRREQNNNHSQQNYKQPIRMPNLGVMNTNNQQK